MQRAGRAISAAVLRDFEEIGGFSPTGRLLVLVGKGHNGGDALLAAAAILTRFPAARADVLLVFGEHALRPLALRAYQVLVHAAPDRVKPIRASKLAGSYELCLDGVFGFQFRAPAAPRVAELIAQVNALSIRLRAAVDLPSAGLFRADFTYATGCVKTPILTEVNAGRLRCLDLGFFADGNLDAEATDRVLSSAVLAPLAELRSPQTDKRSYGHVFLIGGSRGYPGAVLLAARAAVRSGVGLVTAFVPESLVPAYAAQVPEVMWVAWPETPDGGLALEGQHVLTERIARASALVVGPGLGREPETLALVAELAKTTAVPLVLDADALQPEIVTAASGRPRGAWVLTPHAGEFARIAGGTAVSEFATKTGAIVVLKGPITRIADGRTVAHSFFGGPVLARGGSGDLLAGLIGGLLAQTPKAASLAAVRGVVWHGMAADALARTHGQTAVQISQLLDFLPAALRDSAHE